MFNAWYSTYRYVHLLHGRNLNTFLKALPFNSSINSAFNIIALGLLLHFLSRVIGFNDLFIIVLAMGSFLLGNVTILAATFPNLMYMASVFKMLTDTTTLCIRYTFDTEDIANTGIRTIY